jgi:hypothetical protein
LMIPRSFMFFFPSCFHRPIRGTALLFFFFLFFRLVSPWVWSFGFVVAIRFWFWGEKVNRLSYLFLARHGVPGKRLEMS